MAKLTNDQIEEAKENFRKMLEAAQANGLPPEWQKLSDLIYLVVGDEEARDTLRKEIIKRYGE